MSETELQMEEFPQRRPQNRLKIAAFVALGVLVTICVGLAGFYAARQTHAEEKHAFIKPPASRLSNSSEVLLIAGGSFEKSAEIVSLSDEPITCADTPPDLKVYGSYGYGAGFLHKGDPVFCSGSDDCIKYSPSSKSWQPLSPMTEARDGTVKIELGDYILLAGGDDIISSEHWNPTTEEFTRGPDLPYPAFRACAAGINETHAILTGGFNGNDGLVNHAFMFNKATKEWTQLRPMKSKRYQHACGLVAHSKVFVAGGVTEADDSTTSVEVYDLGTQEWSSGPALPIVINKAASVQLEDTFLILGGFTRKYANISGLVVSLKTLYEYKLEDNNWTLRTEQMRVKRSEKPAVWRLPVQYFNCA